MNFAKELREKANINSDEQKRMIQKSVNKFKELAMKAAEEGLFNKKVFFAYYSSDNENQMFDIINKSILILREDLGFVVSRGTPYRDSEHKEVWLVPITLYW